MSTICANIKCQAIDSIIEDGGELVCCECGRVYAENLVADEYETYDGDDEIKRVGPAERPEQAREPGTNLVIKSGKTKHYRSHQKYTKIERNCYRFQKYLANAGVMQNIIESTKSLYVLMAPHKNMQGRNFNHIIAALYYYALRLNSMAKKYKEVSNIFPSITERQIRKAYNSIKWHIAEHNDENEIFKIEKNFVHLYINGNKDKYDAKMLSYEILKNINDQALLEGKSPNTVAGLSLLLSFKLSNDNFDNVNEKDEIYHAFSNKASIAKAFEDIKEDLDKIIPQKYSDKIEGIKNSKI